VLFMARGLHVPLLATWLARGAAATASPATPPPPLESAAPIEDAARSTESTEGPEARVGALINEGQARFDTADYVGAIERWTGAYAQLPDDPHLAAARNLLAYQIAQAHIEAFAMDPQLAHLRKAERLLLQYIAGLDPSEAEARLDAEHRLETVRAQLRAAMPPPAARPTRPPAALAPTEPPGDRSRGPLLLLGGLNLGLGLGLLVGTAVSAVSAADLHGERQRVKAGADAAELDRLRMRETRANQATIATAVVGGALITTGVALLITGHVRKRAWTAQPTLAPGLVGARLTLRF